MCPMSHSVSTFGVNLLTDRQTGMVKNINPSNAAGGGNKRYEKLKAERGKALVDTT